MDRLAVITEACNAKGLTVHTHAMGDAAVRDVTTAYIQGGDGTHRNCLVHLRNVDANDFQRMADNNIACTAGLTWHVANKEDKEMSAFVPAEYLSHSYPMKSFYDVGVRASSHTDYPANDVSPQDPFGIIEVAVTGQLPTDEKLPPHDTDELITVEQAFQALTLNGAWQVGLENERGSIKVGKWADFVLADQDVFTCEKTDIGKTKVVSTWFEGERVYPAPDGSKDCPWAVGGEGHETEVTAWTNGTDTLVIEGAGEVGLMPWAGNADGITELVKEKGVSGLEGVMATLPDLENVNGLTLVELASAGMVGAVKATGFSAIAVDPTRQEATLSVVVSKTESLDEPEWKPVSTNDIPVKADTSAGFFIVAPTSADVRHD